MNNTIITFGLGLLTLVLSACQVAPRQYNGVTGYQVEDQTKDRLTISYTLASQKDLKLDESKLIKACQKVTGSNQAYKINVLSINEIPNPSQLLKDKESIQIGQSRASFGFSNSQSLNSDQDLATHQALENTPNLLQVVRYTCS